MAKRRTRRAKSPKASTATADQPLDYRARWKLVNETILELDRKVPVAQRYRDFLKMVALTKAMNWHTSTPEENARVARLWQRLREIDRAQKETRA